jgi:hypothetical protein
MKNVNNKINDHFEVYLEEIENEKEAIKTMFILNLQH